MTYLNRSDIPFHYAHADAFTICDAFHRSLIPTFGWPTPPNGPERQFSQPARSLVHPEVRGRVAGQHESRLVLHCR
jgi:hypothetical protein